MSRRKINRSEELLYKKAVYQLRDNVGKPNPKKGNQFKVNQAIKIFSNKYKLKKPEGLNYRRWIISMYSDPNFELIGSHHDSKTPKIRVRINKSDWWIKYNKYLKSAKWTKVREFILKDRGNKCERCSSTTTLQVHHKTYKNVFNEDMGDLELLCFDCHKKEHNVTSFSAKKIKTRKDKIKKSKAKKKTKKKNKYNLSKYELALSERYKKTKVN